MSTEMKMRAERDGPPMSELVKCHCGSGRHRAWSAPHCLTCERTCSDRSRYIEVPDELTDLEAMSLVLSAGLGLSEDEIAIGFSWLPVPKHQPGRQFWNIWQACKPDMRAVGYRVTREHDGWGRWLVMREQQQPEPQTEQKKRPALKLVVSNNTPDDAPARNSCRGCERVDMFDDGR